MPADEGVEPDRLPGAPHPRKQTAFFGHGEAEHAFLDACLAGRLHHAWLIGGPSGIGKATLAYRVARFLLAGDLAGREASATLSISPASATARQVAALSHPNLIVLRRSPATEKKSPSTTIPIDAVRRALALFGSTAANGGYRIGIVDSAEDLTPASANALLKLIEEPPPRSIFLIVSHAPQRVLPTIRSRCRRLLLKPLSDGDLRSVVRSLGPPWAEADDAALAQAIASAAGSVRRALEVLDPRKGRSGRGDENPCSKRFRAPTCRGFLRWPRNWRGATPRAHYDLMIDTVMCWTAAHLRAAGVARARRALHRWWRYVRRLRARRKRSTCTISTGGLWSLPCSAISPRPFGARPRAVPLAWEGLSIFFCCILNGEPALASPAMLLAQGGFANGGPRVWPATGFTSPRPFPTRTALLTSATPMRPWRPTPSLDSSGSTALTCSS